MRDYLLTFVNGKQHYLSGEDAFIPLSTFLRQGQGATGTKVVCEEGDCGACTVILGRAAGGKLIYQPVNSCIQFMYQLDCTHVITIEGLKVGGELNAVQDAMVSCHGAQCGYCTPGVVAAMCAMFDSKQEIFEQDIKDGLTGNLCRCTGYEPIIKAGLSVDKSRLVKLAALYPEKEILEAFAEHQGLPIEISADGHKFSSPVDLPGAVSFKAEHQGTVVVAGGTDVSVYWNKRGIAPPFLLSLGAIPGLDELKVENGFLIVGARTTLSRLEEFSHDLIPEFNNLLWLFGSPQIRHAGTLAGNIANGSPIADSLPFLFVMDAEVEVTGKAGVRRVKINKFFKGYKQLDLADDEVITSIKIPLPEKDDLLKLYKVSRRKHLDISAVSAAIRLKKNGDLIKSASVAFGGVAPVVLRLSRTEEFLAGKPFALATFEKAGSIARGEISPISDVRGTADYRKQLAQNLLIKFYHETNDKRELACRQ